jgi:hypothetical protein
MKGPTDLTSKGKQWYDDGWLNGNGERKKAEGRCVVVFLIFTSQQWWLQLGVGELMRDRSSRRPATATAGIDGIIWTRIRTSRRRRCRGDKRFF